VRAAALELADVVPAADRLSLAFFTRELEPASVLREADATGPAALDLAALLRARSPSGGTDVIAALEQLARSKAKGTRQTLALLLSDGRDPSAAQHREQASLRSELAAARIELAVFAFGPDADTMFLASLLPPGRDLARVDDPRNLGAIFARAIDAERVRQPTVTIVSSAETFAQGSLANSLASSLAPAAPPTIESSWIAKLNGSADVLWRSATGEPLLALRVQGLGACAAFASLPAEGWASATRAPAVLGPLLRALARGTSGRTALPRATLERGELWIRGLPPSVPAAIVAIFPGEVELTLSPPTDLADAPLTARTASVPGELLATLSGIARTCVLELRTPKGEALCSVALAPPRPAEFSLPPARFPEPMPPDPVSGASPRRAEPHPAAAWVLLGSIALLVAALLLGLRTR
jgi:hypothetical protein